MKPLEVEQEEEQTARNHMKNLKQIHEEIFSPKQFKKYFLIKSKSGNNLAEINVIKANKQLTNHLRGKPSKVLLLLLFWSQLRWPGE